MLVPNRNYSTEDYRYGFNGMEKDDELKGKGNSYTTEFRQYDPRSGRWLSLDPISRAWESHLEIMQLFIMIQKETVQTAIVLLLHLEL